jgi:hypothetical protein
MSKKVFVLSVQPDPDGPTFGRVFDPVQFQNSQDYSHGHIQQVVKDLLTAGAASAQVAGFLASVTTGLNVSVVRGTVVDANGVSYDSESDDPTVVTMAAAHATLARIDLIYGTLEIDAEAESEFLPFRQLRTEAELASGADPYVPTQFNQPTELHTKVTLAVRTGTPGASPVAPAAGAGEVPLWTVHVAATQTVLGGGDLTSVRVLMKSLYQSQLEIAVLQALVTPGGIAEIVQDIVGAMVTAGTGITPTYNDGGNIETIALDLTFLTEKTQDIVGAFLSSPNGSLVVTYDDAGNAESVQLASGYKALLDGATAADTVSTLMLRDGSGNTRLNEVKVDAGTRYMADGSFQRSTFVREDFYSLIDQSIPVSFTGAVAGVFETVKRQAETTLDDPGVGGNVTMRPEFDLYVDPADLVGISCKLEIYAIQTGNVHGSSVQLWNLTNSSQLALLSFTWLESDWHFRSSLFSITGSGAQHLVLRARSDIDVNGAAKIWRARLIFNPSF